MVFKLNIDTSEKFNDSSEFKNLIDAKDKNRIEDVRLKREEWLEANSNLKNIHGYKFELEVWDFFLSLEPLLINDISREFKLDFSSSNKDQLTAYQNSKQTDILAVFDKHIFIIECKSTKKNNTKLQNLKKEMQLLEFLSKYKEKRINDLFDDYVVVNMLFTDGYELPSPENKKDGLNLIQNLLNKNPPIAFFAKTYMEYINQVREESESSEFAYKQFLGFFRSDQPDYAERDNNGNAKKSKIRAFTSKFSEDSKKRSFTFSISPEDMLKISTVAHSRQKNIYLANQDNEKYYQRLLKKGRIKSISNFLKESNQSFPNNILVSYRGEEGLDFTPDNKADMEESIIGNVPGTLSFFKCPGTFHVIDGQHRLFGYTGLEKDSKIRNEHRLIVTAFEGLKVEDEAKLFLEINNEAKAVNPSLIMEIEWAGQSITKKNLANGIVFHLRDKEESCLKDKVQQAEESSYKLSPKNFQTALMKTEILERDSFNKINFKKKNHNWSEMLKSVDNLYTFFNSLLQIIEKKNPDLWNTSRRKSQRPGLLRDILIGALVMIIDRVALEVISNNPPLNRKELFRASKPYISLLANELNKASKDDLHGDKGLLNLDFYKIRGGGASKLVGQYLISKLLKKKYPNLVFKDDIKDVAALDLGLQGQMDKYEKYLRKNYLYVEQRKEGIPISNKSRTQRGNTYHNIAKFIIEGVFALEQHYVEPWQVLVMPCFYPKEGTPEDTKKKNPFYKYNLEYAESQARSGARTYQSAFNLIEGISLYNLIAQPIKHKNIKPANIENKNEIIERVTDYIWNNLLIFPEGVEVPKDKPDLKDKLWAKGADYIKLFYRYRGSPGGSFDDPHFSEYTGELEEYDELFDYYESKFSILVRKVLIDIDPGEEKAGQIDSSLPDDYD